MHDQGMDTLVVAALVHLNSALLVHVDPMQVVEVSPDMRSGEERVHGALRFVNQADGTDLDPTGRMAAAAMAGDRLSPTLFVFL